MKKLHKKIEESTCSGGYSAVKAEEKNLIVFKNNEKRNIDETISEPERYVSRYHYSSKNIDRYIDYCPHCKKPTLSAFHRSVVDNAIDYLEGKRVLAKDIMDNPRILTFITLFLFLVAVSVAWSRTFLKRHYILDASIGFLIGIIIGFFVKI